MLKIVRPCLLPRYYRWLRSRCINARCLSRTQRASINRCFKETHMGTEHANDRTITGQSREEHPKEWQDASGAPTARRGQPQTNDPRRSQRRSDEPSSKWNGTHNGNQREDNTGTNRRDTKEEQRQGQGTHHPTPHHPHSIVIKKTRFTVLGSLKMPLSHHAYESKSGATRRIEVAR